MFNKLKQFQDLKNQAQSLKEILEREQIEVEDSGIKLVMNGNQKIISLSLPEEMSKEEIEQKIPFVFEQALKKVQRLMVEKMQTGGINIPGM